MQKNTRNDAVENANIENLLKEKSMDQGSHGVKEKVAEMLCSVAFDKYCIDKTAALPYYREAANEGSLVGALATVQIYVRDIADVQSGKEYFKLATKLYYEKYGHEYVKATRDQKQSNFYQGLNFVEKSLARITQE
ncbi:hypothetical protein AwErysi_09110 [Erysipelotrichaceae bacterium]|nr:hypothetical protein AwErysi_09110 [Erysipelotrichaceae bacterium]